MIAVFKQTEFFTISGDEERRIIALFAHPDLQWPPPCVGDRVPCVVMAMYNVVIECVALYSVGHTNRSVRSGLVQVCLLFNSVPAYLSIRLYATVA